MPGSTSRPMYVIGDVHGDAERLIKIMQNHELIEISSDSLCWTKRGVIVLLMGDVLDAKSRVGDDSSFRGSMSDMWIMEFLSLCGSEAAKHGSSLYVLLGNHELMNFRGDFRYVSPEHMPGGAIDRNPEREKYFRSGRGYDILVSGLFLTSIVYNGNHYSHAGIPLEASPLQSKLLDKKVTAEVLKLDALSPELESLVSHRDYYRSDSSATERTRTTSHIATILRSHGGVHRMVVGHNFTNGQGIVSDWQGQVVFTDVGISKAFTPQASLATSQVLYDPGDGSLVALNMNGTMQQISQRRI